MFCLPTITVGQAKLLLPNALSTTEGLTDNLNEFMHRDSRGFMWFSSGNGVNRYDGKRVKVYKPNSRVNSLSGSSIQSNFFEDATGNLWFCTYDAINCYRRQTDDFASFQINLKQTKIVSDYYAFSLEKQHILWLLIRGKIIKFDIHTQQVDTLKDIFNFRRAKVLTDEKGHVTSILGYKYGISKDLEILNKIENGSFKLEKHQIVHGNNPSCRVNDIAFDTPNSLWLATDNGLLLYDLKKKALIDSIKTDETRLFSSVFKVENDHLLVVSKNNGIYWINLPQKRIETHFTSKDYPQFSSLRDAYLDTLSNLWLSEWFRGITHINLKKSKFKQLFHNNKEENKASILRIIEDKTGQIWSMNSNGIVYVFNRKNDNKKEINIALLNREGNEIRVKDIICDDLGRILICSMKKLYVYSSDFRLIAIKPFPFNSPLYYAKKLMDNTIVLSTTDSIGLATLNTDLKMDVIPILAGLKKEKKSLLNVHETREGLLFVNFNQESLLILKKKDQAYTLEKKIDFPSQQYVFYEPSEDTPFMWIGTSKGLLKFDKKRLEIVEQFDEESGLPEQFICGILPLSANELMLSTSKGLISFNTQNHETHRFTLADGLQDEQFNAHAFLKDKEGMLWFGGVNGINCFRPEDIKPLTVPAIPHIVNLKVNDQDWQSPVNITEATEFTFPYSQRTLTFELVAIEYSDSKSNLIQYRLKNYDDKWLTVKNTEGSARYANLPSGTYYLQIKAANSDGIWNDKVREVKITILTPWYLTWWFISLCTIATMSLIGYILYLRISKFIDLQEIRIKLYENLHDDLGSRLMAIVMMVDPMALKSKKTTPEAQYTEGSQTLLDIRAIASSIVGNMRRLVWATDPKNDELSNVMQQMNTDKELLMPNVGFIIQADDAIKQLKMDGNKRYQMLAIFNEALTNTNKYAEATLITVTLKKEAHLFTMTITDNGKGFDAAQSRTDSVMSGGQGTRNMVNRAKRINGQVTITSKLGVGTTVRLTFPLASLSKLARLKQFISWTAPK
jgi:ligand-binding sensor domain-containing protein/anti-sigma regulatory factor (Ser/Thr protein kinase)